MDSFWGAGKLSLIAECPAEFEDQSSCWTAGFKCLSDCHLDNDLARRLVEPMTSARDDW